MAVKFSSLKDAKVQVDYCISFVGYVSEISVEGKNGTVGISLDSSGDILGIQPEGGVITKVEITLDIKNDALSMCFLERLIGEEHIKKILHSESKKILNDFLECMKEEKGYESKLFSGGTFNGGFKRDSNGYIRSRIDIF